MPTFRLPYFDFMGAPPRRDPYGPNPLRPSLADLLRPSIEPEYPEAPKPLRRARDLDKADKRQLTMEMLANLAASIGGADKGYLGSALARGAMANVEAERGAVDRANEQQQQTYRQQTIEAERKARAAEATAQRERDRQEAEALLQMGDQAIELAGGADADPTHAARVYSAVRTRNASYLQKLMDDAPARRQMRDVYGVNPDDPQGVEDFKAKRELTRKEAEERALGVIRGEQNFQTHKRERDYDLAHRPPEKPERARLQYDSERGMIVNLDTGTAAPIPGVSPKPRNSKEFDEVEKQAISLAAQDMNNYNRDPAAPQETVVDPATKKATRRRKPFDFLGAYAAHERDLRTIAGQEKAAADPSAGTRGATATVPGPAVQSPKGAPVGMGGSVVGKDKTPTNRSNEQKVRDIESEVGSMTEAQKAVVRKALAAGKLPREIVAEIRRRRG